MIMFLKKLRIVNFKNIADAELDFSPKINCILGNNGEGKTNLLDAVYFLSMTKSFFNLSDNYLLYFGEKSCGVNGEYIMQDGSIESVSLGIKLMEQNQGGYGKSAKRNGKPYSRLSDHIGLIPIVMVSPADTVLVNGSGEERRRFMNYVLSQTDREYLRRIQSYNQLLAQRNKLLKMQEISDDLLDTLSQQLSSHAAYIYSKRGELSAQLSLFAEDYYNKLSGGRERIELKYLSDLSHKPMYELLQEAVQRDKILHYTSVGVQRDDIDFMIDGYPIKKIGSQGQQKSFLISLKLAQFALIRRDSGEIPLLLLDDVFDKLDMKRVEFLLGIVSSSLFGQIFITDSNKVRMDRILDSVGTDSRSFIVEGGSYNEA